MQHGANLATINARLAAGSITREALIEQSLQACSLPAAAHVFTKIYADGALAAARQADRAQAAGIKQHALAGLPVSIKDLFDIAEETTLAGSLACVGEAPAQKDAVAVARLRGVGMAIIGKTNMTEFAFSGVGINPHYGTPLNPADAQVARIAGGSSSGAAVSVALGLAVAALGSDTGGSIRIPAALCGLVGFKSTRSRVACTGAFALAPTLDTVCAMTHSVADCLMIDGIIAGEPLSVQPGSLSGLRLAIPGTLLLDGLEPAVAQAFSRACTTLSNAGAVLVDLPLHELEELARINHPASLAAMEAYTLHQQRLKTHRVRYDPRVAARMDSAAASTPSDYRALLAARHDWSGRVTAQLRGFDALMCPTVPIVAPLLAPLLASDDAFFRCNALLLRNSHVINFLDGCAFSLPCHATNELPVGLMLSSCTDDDARLASVVLAVEAALQYP